MKRVAIIFYIFALVLGIFGYWGSYTKSGRANFDEMAGMIPFIAALISVVFFLFAVIFSLMYYFRRK